MAAKIAAGVGEDVMVGTDTVSDGVTERALCLLRHHRELGGARQVSARNAGALDAMVAAAFQRRVRKELGLVGPLSRALSAASGSSHPLLVPPSVANP